MNQTDSFLVLGSAGQLGKAFVAELVKRGITVHAPSEAESNITDFAAIEHLIGSTAPTVVINCAAYNAVDDAEKNAELAMLINGRAVENLSRICAKQSCRLVHYSSDYVFDGSKGDLHNEEDAVNPLNAYGRSKRVGEEAVLNILPSGLVLRTSWVYGDGTQNFLFKLRGWSDKNRILRVSSDEVSVPTSTTDLVHCTLLALEKQLTGLFHCTNSGYASRYEWARCAVEAWKKDNIVIPVPMSSFPSPALRPLFSAMSNRKLETALGIAIPDWKEAVVRFLTTTSS